TFGANPISLRRHGLDGRMHEINLAAAAIARKAAGEDRYIIGDIGPTGDFLEPLGALKEADLFAAYAGQAKALEEGGVDGFIIETMMALDELTVAVKAVKSVTAKPVFASMAFDSAPDGARTMMGVTPKMMVAAMTGLGIRAVGFNCGTLDMDSYIKLAQMFTSALFGGYILLIAQPNAGRPELVGDKAVYNLTPAEYAEAMVKIRNCGAAILGGCCGTSPAHLAAAISANK
ncbi:MAG: homocysteine S-methyltransferase family protein, partial [Anaerohalosphaeraceae bacterium]